RCILISLDGNAGNPGTPPTLGTTRPARHRPSGHKLSGPPMPQGLSAGPPAAYPARPGRGPTQRRLAACLSTRNRAAQKTPGPARQRRQVSPPGTAPPNRHSTANSWGWQNQGPPRSQRHHERAGRRLYKRIEAVAATLEAEWAEQAGAPRRGKLRATLSDLLTPPPGQPVRPPPLNPGAPAPTRAPPGGPALPPPPSISPAAPIISARRASASARAGLRREGGRGARRSQRPGAGRGAAGGEGQRGGEQCGGDDRPQHQQGLRPAPARVQAAGLRESYAPARVPPGAARTGRPPAPHPGLLPGRHLLAGG